MLETLTSEQIIKYGYDLIVEDLKRKGDKEMDDNQKTPEQLRAELMAQIKESGMEYVNEVAMPGVLRPVKSDD